MRVVVVVGTRPEAIKMAPLVMELRRRGTAEICLCATGQHRELLHQALAPFGLTPDIVLSPARRGGRLNDLTAAIIGGFDTHLADLQPDIVLTHGDTTSAMATSLAASQRGIPVGHVEAGLRSHDLASPWPEEANRRIIDAVASHFFAPTDCARDNLIREGAAAARIHVTGNTVVDALRHMLSRQDADAAGLARSRLSYGAFLDAPTKILVTCHRRENWGDPLARICAALRIIAADPDLSLLQPLHGNPAVAAPVSAALSGLRNVHLVPPAGYGDFLYLLSRSDIVITDSGGVQEEAVSIGKRVLVLRDTTERPEGIAAGLAELVGTDIDRIVSGVQAARLRPNAVPAASGVYGDGHAARRIADVILPSGRH